MDKSAAFKSILTLFDRLHVREDLDLFKHVWNQLTTQEKIDTLKECLADDSEGEYIVEELKDLNA